MVSQLRADLCSRVGDSWSMFEFIQAISTRIPKIPCLSINSIASRHLQTTMFLKSREVFDWILIGHHFQADICLRSGHGTGSSVAELETVMYTQNETDGASVDHSVGVKISCTGFKGAAQVIGCTDRPS